MRRGAAVLVAATLAVLLAASPAAAQYTPTLFTTTTDGRSETTFSPGERFLAHGNNWPPDTNLQVTFTQNPTTVLGTVRTRADGSFVGTFTIPTTAVVGLATLSVSGGGFQRQVQLRITGAADRTPEPPAATPRPAEDTTRGPAAQTQTQRQEQVQIQEVVDSRSGGRGGLPKTGQEMALYGGGGGLLFLTGVLLLWYARRRGRDQDAQMRAVLGPQAPPELVRSEETWTTADEESLRTYLEDGAALPPAQDLAALPPGRDEHLVEADILLVGGR